MRHPYRGHRLTPTLFALGLSIGSGACAQEASPTSSSPSDASARSAATASPTWSPTWSISGFGTASLVHSSERDADFTSSVMKKSGAGATRNWSPDVDSRLGVQLDVALNKRWSAVLQMVTEQGIDNIYKPRVEWANIKYQATPELALRVGRVALPMFLTAEYRKIGYIYPWVRPPVESYGTLPVTSGDGIDANLRWNLGAVRNTSQVFYGHADQPLVSPMHAYGRKVLGLANTTDWNAFSVRASLLTGEINAGVADELFAALNSAGPAGQALTRAYAIDHKDVSVASVGASYDPGNWFLMAEASRTRTDSLLGATRSIYASAGWRHGAFTPYVTLAHVRAAIPTTVPGLPMVEGLPPALAAQVAGQVAALNAGVNALLSTIPEQSSVSTGLRWDVVENTALKLQYDRVTPHGSSRGTQINQTPAFVPGRTTHVVSVAVDFVF